VVDFFFGSVLFGSALRGNAWESLGISTLIPIKEYYKHMGSSVCPKLGLIGFNPFCPFCLLYFYEVFTMTTKSKSVVVQVVAESAKTAQFSLPVAQLSLIDDALEGFFVADSKVFEAKEIIRKSAGSIAKVLGINPDYAHWMGVRDTTIGRMMAMKSSMTEETAKSYWEKVICGALKAEFQLEKPKSVSAEAEKKRKQREAKAKKLEGYTDSQLLEKAKEFGMALEFDKAKEFKDELTRRAKESDAGLVNECKEVRGEIVLRLKSCLNLELLEEIRDMLPPVVIKAE